MSERYQFFYRFRGVLMAPPLLFLVLCFRWEEEHLWIWPVGLALFAGGVLTRVWAQTHLHYRLRERKHLTTTGPYGIVRNPIYVANTTMLLGLAILCELVWFLPIMLLWCAGVYHYVVRREEHHLLEKYGQPYADYLMQVPRWLPMSFVRKSGGLDRRYVLRSMKAELHCLLLLVAPVAKEVVSELLHL